MKNEKFSINNYYHFRYLSEKDATYEYLNWLNDVEVTEFLEVRHTKYNISDLRVYIESFNGEISKYLFGIFSNGNNEHIGNVTLYNINMKNGFFEQGYLIGNKNYWGGNAGISALLFSFHFAFDKLNLENFKSGTYSNNLKSRFLLKKIGCKEADRVEGKFFYKNKPITEIFYSMSKKEWSLLKNKYDASIFKECF